MISVDVPNMYDLVICDRLIPLEDLTNTAVEDDVEVCTENIS